MDIKDILKKLKGPDRERIRTQAEEFQATIGQPRPEEAGLEEGDLTDYAPQGLVKGAIKKMASKGPRTAAGIASQSKDVPEMVNYQKELSDGTKLIYEIPKNIMDTLKKLDVKSLKPYLKDIENPAVGAGRPDAAMKVTGATTGWKK